MAAAQESGTHKGAKSEEGERREEGKKRDIYVTGPTRMMPNYVTVTNDDV